MSPSHALAAIWMWTRHSGVAIFSCVRCGAKKANTAYLSVLVGAHGGQQSQSCRRRGHGSVWQVVYCELVHFLCTCANIWIFLRLVVDLLLLSWTGPFVFHLFYYLTFTPFQHPPIRLKCDPPLTKADCTILPLRRSYGKRIQQFSSGRCTNLVGGQNYIATKVGEGT
ncbi:hypothetical protein DFH29DRAFT_145677 [Suillus ampliporus]|nr:hypothetical protein DFH29DRAFT_145677 [Suillus ampliporus]